MQVYRRTATQASGAGQSRNRDRWTTSYADFVTILLVLFVAIAAQGLQSAMPVKLMAVAAAPLPAKPVLAAPVPAQPTVLALLAPLGAKGVKLNVESRGIVISLPQKVLFDSGDDRISRAALEVVGEIAEVLQGIPNKVTLIGHADSRPIHSKRFRDNWQLSVARSLRLRQLLCEEYGIDEDRLSVSSFGANSPADSSETEEGRANNRRVEIVIAGSDTGNRE